MSTYGFLITLYSEYYDDDEKIHQIPYGTRKHVGTEETARAAARRTRTKADTARVERVAVHDGPKFADHEIKTFTIGLDPH